MNPKPLELYDVEVPIGESNYRRPFVITRVEHFTITGFPLSTKVSTFFKPALDFLIRESDAEFRTTGLDVESFIVGANEYDLPITALKKYRGNLMGAR